MDPQPVLLEPVQVDFTYAAANYPDDGSLAYTTGLAGGTWRWSDTDGWQCFSYRPVPGFPPTPNFDPRVNLGLDNRISAESHSMSEISPEWSGPPMQVHYYSWAIDFVFRLRAAALPDRALYSRFLVMHAPAFVGEGAVDLSNMHVSTPWSNYPLSGAYLPLEFYGGFNHPGVYDGPLPLPAVDWLTALPDYDADAGAEWPAGGSVYFAGNAQLPDPIWDGPASHFSWAKPTAERRASTVELGLPVLALSGTPDHGDAPLTVYLGGQLGARRIIV